MQYYSIFAPYLKVTPLPLNFLSLLLRLTAETTRAFFLKRGIRSSLGVSMVGVRQSFHPGHGALNSSRPNVSDDRQSGCE